VPLGAVPALSWCGEVPLGGIILIISILITIPWSLYYYKLFVLKVIDYKELDPLV